MVIAFLKSRGRESVLCERFAVICLAGILRCDRHRFRCDLQPAICNDQILFRIERISIYGYGETVFVQLHVVSTDIGALSFSFFTFLKGYSNTCRFINFLVAQIVLDFVAGNFLLTVVVNLSIRISSDLYRKFLLPYSEYCMVWSVFIRCHIIVIVSTCFRIICDPKIVFIQILSPVAAVCFPLSGFCKSLFSCQVFIVYIAAFYSGPSKELIALAGRCVRNFDFLIDLERIIFAESIFAVVLEPGNECRCWLFTIYVDRL